MREGGGRGKMEEELGTADVCRIYCVLSHFTVRQTEGLKFQQNFPNTMANVWWHPL